MLVLSMMRNKNINIDEKSIDFESFYNCNTKINQQGHILAKKLFKVFNNKTNNKVLSFENYINGMIKLKNSSKCDESKKFAGHESQKPSVVFEEANTGILLSFQHNI
jgi:hypothetical protein